MKNLTLKAIACLAVLSLATGCLRKPPEINPVENNPYPGNRQEDTPNGLSVVTTSSSPSNGDPDSEVVCTTTKYRYAPVTNMLWAYSGLPSMLIGHLYGSESVASGSPQKLIYEPSDEVLTVTLSGIPLDGPTTYPIGDREKTTDAINKLITTPLLTETPSIVDLSIDSVTSLEHLALRFYGSVDVIDKLQVASSFSFSNTNTSNKVLARFEQKFFSLDLGGIEDENSFFAKKLPRNNPTFNLDYEPVYLNSITYGRIINVAIESSAGYTEINAAMSAAAEIKSVEAQAEFELQYGDLMRSSTINIKIFGGNAAEIVFNNGVPDFFGMIGSLKYDPINNPGTPINYVFTGLHDRQQYSFRNEAEFETTICRDVVDSYDLRLDTVKCADCNGRADIYGSIIVKDGRTQSIIDTLFYQNRDDAVQIKEDEPFLAGRQTRIKFVEPNPSTDYFIAVVDLHERRVGSGDRDRDLTPQQIRWQIDNILETQSSSQEVPWSTTGQRLVLDFTVSPNQ